MGNITQESIIEDLRYLQLLSHSFPTIADASTEIINLEAILNLPKGTEHFLTDLHGEYEAFQHVLKNASGAVKRKVNEIFGHTLRESEKKEMPLYAGYLASYGDDRALPVLLEHIRRSDIDFVTFQELKFAIEALGGEYTEQRDFSEDESYKKIMEAGAGTDIFGSKRG